MTKLARSQKMNYPLLSNKKVLQADVDKAGDRENRAFFCTIYDGLFLKHTFMKTMTGDIYFPNKYSRQPRPCHMLCYPGHQFPIATLLNILLRERLLWPQCMVDDFPHPTQNWYFKKYRGWTLQFQERCTFVRRELFASHVVQLNNFFTIYTHTCTKI